MDAKQLAAELTGIEYSALIHFGGSKLEASAKSEGLVIAYGVSDDLFELEGAICDEAGCYEGGTILVDAKGVLPSWESASESEESAKDYFERKAKARSIQALWAKEGDYSWTYRTDIPHETFEIVEDGGPYCRGIVFALADLEKVAAK